MSVSRVSEGTKKGMLKVAPKSIIILSATIKLRPTPKTSPAIFAFPLYPFGTYCDEPMTITVLMLLP